MEENYKEIYLTIFIPVRNRCEELTKCLNRLLEFGGNNKSIEVLLIDNNSTDGTKDVIVKYATKFQNLRFFFNKKNEGYTYSQIKGFKEAKGKYIALLSSDDYYTKNTIELILLTIKEHNPIALAMNYYNMLEGGKIKIIGPTESQVFNRPWDLWCHPSVGHWSGLIVKRDEFRKFFNKFLQFDKEISSYEQNRGVIGLMFTHILANSNKDRKACYIGKPLIEVSRPKELDYNVLEHIYLNEIKIYKGYFTTKVISKQQLIQRIKGTEKDLYKAVILNSLNSAYIQDTIMILRKYKKYLNFYGILILLSILSYMLKPIYHKFKSGE